jgi:hypothetical protein
LTKDSNGNLIEKEEISYDKRGLKTHVRKLDGQGALIEEKFYTYE